MLNVDSFVILESDNASAVAWASFGYEITVKGQGTHVKVHTPRTRSMFNIPKAL
jgi:hypothetical protein